MVVEGFTGDQYCVKGGCNHHFVIPFQNFSLHFIILNNESIRPHDMIIPIDVQVSKYVKISFSLKFIIYLESWILLCTLQFASHSPMG
jgi:hypothetical protein